MPQDIDFHPTDPGTDFRVAGNIDSNLVRTRSAQGYGVNLNGMFERAETIFSGIVNGFRVGKWAVGSASWSATFSAMLAALGDIQDYIGAVRSDLGLGRKSLVDLAEDVSGSLRILINNGTHILASVGDVQDFLSALRSDLSKIENPVDKLSVLYLAYNYAANAVQTYQVNPAQAHLNGPAYFLNEVAQRANGTHDFVIPCLPYSFCGVTIEWTTNGTRTFQWDIYGKLDDGAFPAAAARAAFNINTWFQTTAGGTGFGAVGVTGGTLVARTMERLPFRELLIQATVAATDANNSTVEGWYDLYGGAR